MVYAHLVALSFKAFSAVAVFWIENQLLRSVWFPDAAWIAIGIYSYAGQSKCGGKVDKPRVIAQICLALPHCAFNFWQRPADNCVTWHNFIEPFA